MLLLSASCGQSKDTHLARGEEYLQKRKFHEAVMEFRSAVEIDKNSAQAHWGLARAHENLGQFTETLDELRKTVELAPENLEANAKLGNYFLLTQPPMIDEAAKTLEQIFARDDKFIEGHILKASILAAQKKPDAEVVEVLNQAIALNPNRTESYLSLARFFMSKDKAAEAEGAIKKGIAVNPNVAAGYVEYGRFLDYANRTTEAEAQFVKATEVEPKNIEAREAQAEFYLAARQYEKAETAYRELVQIQQNSPESRLQLGNFYAVIGREDEALKVFSEILKDAPEYVRARYRLGEIHLDRKETDKVNEQIEVLLSINDDDTEALMLRARVKLQENKAEEAVKDLEEILKKLPSQKDALFYMTQARLALGQVDQARAFIGDLEKYHPNFLKTKLLKIQAAFSGGESEAALRLANELYELAGNSFPNAETDAQDLQELRVRAKSARGLAYLELGKIAEAKTDLQEIVKLSPNSSGAFVNLAKVYAAEGNLAEALNLYEKSLAADGKNFDALGGAVNVLIRQKQTVQAHGKIDQSLQQNAGKADVSAALHYLKSQIYAAENNAEAAETELKKSIEADENYLPAYSGYAALLVRRNQTDKAVEQYKLIVEKKPSASVYTLLGILEDGRGNAPEAEKNYRKALEITPDAPIAANNLAWLLAENQGNLDEALMLAQKSVSQIQNSAGFYDTLGWIYYKKGLYTPAVEQLKKAVALDEAESQKAGKAGNSAYRLRLGTALASAGDKLSARREVENSLQNAGNLSQKDAQEARNLLATL
ncbi:MAG: tetratricopeptide repeat protein [Acidobacteriota bacterium]|nr:tetratricopeptide repeat protein [Acidobacteriota bacterium]